MMDCKDIERLLPSYTLSSLDELETDRFIAHVDSCPSCAATVREAGDTLVNLARIVPQKRPPAHVKERLLARIDNAKQHDPESPPTHPWGQLARSLIYQIASRSLVSSAVVAVLVVAVVAGVWYSRNLQNLEEIRGNIERQIETAAQREQDLREKLRQQRGLSETIATDPGVTIKQLSADASATVSDAFPAGMIVISAKENTATIVAMNLPQLPPSQTYHVWLIKQGGLEVKTAALTVDSTGYGQADIPLNSPLEEFRAVLIAIGEAKGSSDSIHDSVLRVDL